MTPDRIERYRLIREISQEKYATVFEAQNEKNSQLVHLRLYPDNFFSGEVMQTEFESRGAILNRISNPAVLPVYQYGSYGDRPYIVSPVMEGGSLEEQLESRTKLEPAEIVPIAERIATALDALHAQKTVHGNLTPDSIWFNLEGVAYLGGFVMPTPAPDQMSDLSWYSPEYLKGKEAVRQSDIYSLSVLLYRMLTGVTPFVGKTSSEISHLLLQDEIPSVGLYVEKNIAEVDQFFKLGLDYVHLNRPIFASELVNRFKYIFRIATPVDQKNTQAHDDSIDRSTRFNIISKSDLTADFEKIPTWMFTFGAHKVGVRRPRPLEQSPEIDEFGDSQIIVKESTEMTAIGDLATIDPNDVESEPNEVESPDADLHDTNIFYANPQSPQNPESLTSESPVSDRKSEEILEPAQKDPKVARRRASMVASTLIGLISLFVLGALVLFGLAMADVIRPQVATPIAEIESTGEDDPELVSPAITGTVAVEETEIDPEAGLIVDIPTANSAVLETTSYAWESLPPSSTFLRRSRSNGFTLEEAGWYMYSNANTIRDVVQVGDVIYAASGAGLTVWDLEAGVATRLTSYDGLVGNDINQIVYCEIPDPKLIIASESGVGILDLETLENEILDAAGRQLVNNHVSSIACKNEGTSVKLYVGYANDGFTVHEIGNGSRERIDRIDRSDGLPTDAVDQILLVDEVAWINTGSSLLHFNQSTGEVESFSKAEGTLPSQNISEMVWDSEVTGLVWMATNDGLLAGNSRGEFTLYTDENTNLPRGLGESVTIDDDGVVWYGTGFGNICGFTLSSLSCEKIYRHPTGEFQLEGAITALDVSDGNLVYGHRRDGVRLGTFVEKSDPAAPIQMESWQPLIVPNQFPINEITALAEADGFVWIGTRKGLYKAPVGDLSGENWEYLDNQNSVLPANWITELFPDPDGGMWVGTFRGAVYFGSAWLQEPIMVEQQIRAIAKDNREKNIWIGTNQGIFQYDGRAVSEMRDLPSINVRTLKWVGDDLYIGLEDGRIGVLTGGVFNVFDRNNSPLSPDPVAVIENGPNGTLYVGNGDDLYILNEARTLVQIPQVRGYYISDVIFKERTTETVVSTTSNSLFYYDSIDWLQVTVRDGLPTDRILEMIVDSRGTIWMAGQSLNEEGGGLVRYIPYPADPADSDE
ncbi:MAG: protein kinase [Anaerolineae bacterium]